MANVIPMQMYIENNEVHTEFQKDSKKTTSEVYTLLEECLGKSFEKIKYRKGQKVATGCYTNATGKKYFLIVANVTFMGGTEGQHPKDLKRIQYSVLWRDFYEKYSEKGEVVWLGLYSYKGINIWASFEPQTYLKKHEGKDMMSKGGHMAQYSCHVYLNDLYQGYVNGDFSKQDKNKNTIRTIRFENLKSYFEEITATEENPIISTIKKINANKVEWNRWIMASRAITYMKGLKMITGFNQWKQNLWNGWYVEALYSEYFHQNPSEYIDYIATTDKEDVLIEYKKSGLDLAFPKAPYHFIGDLKAVCEGDGNTLLNDEAKVKAALEKYKKIWFVIYIHEKRQGKTNDYEMVKWRNHFIKDQGEWKPSKKHPIFDEMSAPGTPHSISYSEMVVIELNEITKDKYFTIGKQWGLNSDGSVRGDKFKVSKKMLEDITDDSFVIYRYNPA